MSMLSFLLCVFSILSSSVYGHYGCGADKIKHKKAHKNMNVKPIEHMNNINNNNQNKHKLLNGRAQNPDNSNIYQPIRIHYDTSQLERDWNNYDKKSYFVNDVIPAAYEWLMKAISVRPVNGPLTFDVRCDSSDGTVWRDGPNRGQCLQPNDDWQQCGDTGAIIPEYMFDSQIICPTPQGNCTSSTYPQGSGMINTDLVIYFTADPSRDKTKSCDNVMGFAAYCHTNSRDRPIAGYINLCKSTIDATDVLTWEETISLIVHETFHVLGFSTDGFENFKNDDGSDRTDVYKVITKRGKLRAVITLPTVVEKAKEYFDCDTMDGIELEDYDVDWVGEPSSHWDNRIIAYDFMISYIPPAAPYGIFTLAVLQDSGWYNINWLYAQEAPHGRKKGCQWYDNKCIINGKSIDENVFCTENVQYSCSTSYVGKFYCTLSQWNAELPETMQYFDKSTTGGDNVYPDFCPLLEEYSNGDCRLWGNNNIGTSDGNTALLGGLITGSSKCGLIEGNTNGLGAGCYPTECFMNYKGDYVGTRMTVYRNYYLKTFDVMTCWSDENGVAKQFPFTYDKRENFGFDTIYCPVFTDICYDRNPWICNGHGTIIDGECVCSPGYFGVDCTIENNAANRATYTNDDSLSIYMNKVCNGGIWNYSVSHGNVGILNIEINGINNGNYNSSHFQTALKNWIAILTDISQCHVKLVNYKYDNYTTVTTDIYYYSSDKTWSDVTFTQERIVFNKLFDTKNIIQITEEKPSDGYHENNIDAVDVTKIITISDVKLQKGSNDSNLLTKKDYMLFIIIPICLCCLLLLKLKYKSNNNSVAKKEDVLNENEEEIVEIHEAMEPLTLSNNLGEEYISVDNDDDIHQIAQQTPTDI